MCDVFTLGTFYEIWDKNYVDAGVPHFENGDRLDSMFSYGLNKARYFIRFCT